MSAMLVALLQCAMLEYCKGNTVSLLVSRFLLHAWPETQLDRAQWMRLLLV